MLKKKNAILLWSVISLTFFVTAAAQEIDTTQIHRLHRLVGTWDVYSAEGKEIIGEFIVSTFGNTPALQTLFKVTAMNTEVDGVWTYDSQIKSIVLLEVTDAGEVRNYKGKFMKPEMLWLEGWAKQKPFEVIEKSSLTWLSADKIQVWSSNLKAKQETTVLMVRRGKNQK
jgi:hypothetical protein